MAGRDDDQLTEDEEAEAIGRGDMCVHGVGFDEQCHACDALEWEDDADEHEPSCRHGVPLDEDCFWCDPEEFDVG